MRAAVLGCIWALSIAPAAAADFTVVPDPAARDFLAGLEQRRTFGPFLAETPESIAAKKFIFPTTVHIAVPNAPEGCENSTEPRCKVRSAYVETTTKFFLTFGFLTPPGFNWTIDSVREFPYEGTPECILITLSEQLREQGRDPVTGRWPLRQTKTCVTQDGAVKTDEFSMSMVPMTDEQRAVSSSERPRFYDEVRDDGANIPWRVAVLQSYPEFSECKESVVATYCEEFMLIGLTDGKGKNFVFRTPRGFGWRMRGPELVAASNGAPACTRFTFWEQLRTEDFKKSNPSENPAWPERESAVCASPDGFVAVK